VLYLGPAIANQGTHADHNKRRQHLSVDFEKLEIPRGRASSVSAQTIVAENPDFEARRTTIKRRGTHVALVKVSWWDCLKAALFGPKKLKRQLAATVEWAEVDDTHAEVQQLSLQRFEPRY
jgi:hypothetical protein